MNRECILKHHLLSGLIGMLIGAAIMPPILHWHFRHYWNRNKMHAHMMKTLGSRLNLTPDQKQKVDAIFEENRKKMDALRSEMRPKFEEIRNATREQIKPHLNAEQQKKFEVLDSKLEKRRRGRPDR